MMYRWIALAGLVAAGCGPQVSTLDTPSASRSGPWVDGVSVGVSPSGDRVAISGTAHNPRDAPVDLRVHATAYDEAGEPMACGLGTVFGVPPGGSASMDCLSGPSPRPDEAARAEVDVLSVRPAG